MQNYSVKLQWVTPDAEHIIAKHARVSNPKNQENRGTETKLLSYLLREGHFSPFEMANISFEIKTSRDIARQLLRHKSNRFQEFSQRYADPDAQDFELGFRSARLQDTKNRQNSILCEDHLIAQWWERKQADVLKHAQTAYKQAIEMKIAKEVARCLLPEGLTPTTIYMNCTVRDLIFLLKQRSKSEGAQLEIVAIASEMRRIFKEELPAIYEAAMKAELL